MASIPLLFEKNKNFKRFRRLEVRIQTLLTLYVQDSILIKNPNTAEGFIQNPEFRDWTPSPTTYPNVVSKVATHNSLSVHKLDCSVRSLPPEPNTIKISDILYLSLNNVMIEEVCVPVNWA